MSQISFALLLAHNAGASIVDISTSLQLPENWVEERIASARMCMAQAALLDEDSQRRVETLARGLQCSTSAA